MTHRPEWHGIFSADEQVGLEAWQAPLPGPDAASRVLTRVRRARRGKILRLTAVAAGALIIVAGTWLVRDAESHGQAQLTQRTTLTLGRRGTAVGEPGSRLVWRVRSDGAATIVQSSGNVFYRVEPGGPFSVETPRGTISVIGTCFRVEIGTTESRTAASSPSSAADVATTTAVIVSVYEGKVRSVAGETPDGLDIEAGQVVQMDHRGRVRVIGDVADGLRDPAAIGHSLVATTVTSAGPKPATASAKSRTLAERNRALQRKLDALRSRLRTRDNAKMLNLTGEELNRLAQRCELRWDMPDYGSDPPTVRAQDRERLGLTQSEEALINRVVAAQQQHLSAELKKLYVEVTGNTALADNLSSPALQSEIRNKSPKGEIRAVFQRLARERAGLIPEASLQDSSPFERMMRLLTAMGDRLEQAIGKEVGPDLARQHRELRGGYGSKYRSSHDCPESPDPR